MKKLSLILTMVLVITLLVGCDKGGIPKKLPAVVGIELADWDESAMEGTIKVRGFKSMMEADQTLVSEGAEYYIIKVKDEVEAFYTELYNAGINFDDGYKEFKIPMTEEFEDLADHRVGLLGMGVLIRRCRNDYFNK